jgi:hypothetical protein
MNNDHLPRLMKGILGIFWPGNRIYSQFGEDFIIEKIFRHQKKGFYIDIGCFHPKVASNTYKLYRKGWKGINIDAEKRKIRLFTYFRRRDINLSTIVSDKPDEFLEFIIRKDGSYGSMNKIYESGDSMRCNDFIIEKEPNANINTILNQYCQSTLIDFLNVDVEGADMSILKSINYDKYPIKVICAENHSTSIESMVTSEMYKLLINNNYSLIWWSPPSVIFKRNDYKPA